MMERKNNILDKIAALIPGYKGYVIRDEKRNTDKKLRNEISRVIEQAESLIIKYQQELIQKDALKLCQEWEITRKSLNTICSKIKYSTYGESSLFSNIQLKENELDEIYDIDLGIAERVKLIFKTIESQIDGGLAEIPVNNLIGEIDNSIVKRINFINSLK